MTKYYRNCGIRDLKQYAQIFLDDFWQIWNWSNWKNFEIDIYFCKNITFMNFKVSKEDRKEKIKIIKIEKDFLNLEFVNFLKNQYQIEYSKENKDFCKNSFYKIGQNIKLYWHSVTAYLDKEEFRNAMMESWLKKINNLID